ncbi:MAG: hypothetical protein M1827_003933 [Pycnora praestabilis]|nr:MAG: hypothetical protein M1827_003933 [Pycnora praestabilis]
MDPPPPPASTTTPKIHTYHCLCTHLLLASTHELSSLPRRSTPGLDNAIIVPLPPPPHSSSAFDPSSSSSSSEEEEEEEEEEDCEANRDTSENNIPHDAAATPRTRKANNKSTKPKKKKKKKEDAKSPERAQDLGYSLLLSTTLDRRPLILRREDGFEKRYLWRCGRCRLVVGYQLDGVHFSTTTVEEERGRREDADEDDGGGGARGKVVYVLPGGLMSTEEMKRGKEVGDGEMDLLSGEM